MNNIGKIIYGFCDGYFGRDDYGTKIIVFETDCSIACRYVHDEIWREKGWISTANFDSPEEKQRCIDAWSQYEEVE